MNKSDIFNRIMFCCAPSIIYGGEDGKAVIYSPCPMCGAQKNNDEKCKNCGHK